MRITATKITVLEANDEIKTVLLLMRSTVWIVVTEIPTLADVSLLTPLIVALAGSLQAASEDDSFEGSLQEEQALAAARDKVLQTKALQSSRKSS